MDSVLNHFAMHDSRVARSKSIFQKYHLGVTVLHCKQKDISTFVEEYWSVISGRSYSRKTFVIVIVYRRPQTQMCPCILEHSEIRVDCVICFDRAESIKWGKHKSDLIWHWSAQMSMYNTQVRGVLYCCAKLVFVQHHLWYWLMWSTWMLWMNMFLLCFSDCIRDGSGTLCVSSHGKQTNCQAGNYELQT